MEDYFGRNTGNWLSLESSYTDAFKGVYQKIRRTAVLYLCIVDWEKSQLDKEIRGSLFLT